MVYTLSSPTVIASDAACHPYAREVLDALCDVFRLTDRGVTHLGMYALDTDPAATALAWGMVELLDAAVPSAATTFRATSPDDANAAATLARTRLGDVRDVARLVTSEAACWPDAPRVTIAGGATAPVPAAAAAAAVSAWWTRPDLPPEHAAVLAGPWREMLSHRGVLTASTAASYGPRGGAVVELRAAVSSGQVTLPDLAEAGLPAFTWVQAMHAGAWAAYAAGRLRAQFRAVVDVTASLVRAHRDADPADVRAALPALHALTVAALVDDVLDPEPLAELRLAAIAL